MYLHKIDKERADQLESMLAGSYEDFLVALDILKNIDHNDKISNKLTISIAYKIVFNCKIEAISSNIKRYNVDTSKLVNF